MGPIIQARVFFAKLDGEFNKVNQFYESQECEFIERGKILVKQLQILLQAKQILSDQRRRNSPARSYSVRISPHSPARDSKYSGQYSIFFFKFSSCPNMKISLKILILDFLN